MSALPLVAPEPETAPSFALGRSVIHVGDCRAVLKTLPAASVHCVVTSPPYFGLRDYGMGQAQIGLEESVDAYLDTMVEVFREVWRVLRPDGTLFLNIGDSYAGSGKGPTGVNGMGQHERRQGFTNDARRDSLPPKSLMMIPARLALALQADGWILRSDIAWCKTAPMPESVTDRPTNAWEHIFLFAKQERYFYDAEAVRVESSGVSGGGFSKSYANNQPAHGAMRLERPADNGTRNLWNYWTVSPSFFAEAHFATFPPEIPRRAILAGTSEKGVCPRCGAPWRRVVEDTPDYAAFKAGRPSMRIDDLAARGLTRGKNNPSVSRETVTVGWQPSCRCNAGEPVNATVLDPFAGAGTSLMVANRLGRHAVGIELNPEYAEMARRRIVGDLGMLAQVEVITP